jgi:hypothetical protein
MKIELLYFDGCPNHEAFLPRLREVLYGEGIEDEVRLRRVESAEQAERERFLGSPTLRIDGRDVDPGAAQRTDFGLKCRLYRTEAGMSGVPADEWIVQALQVAADRAKVPNLSVFHSRAWASQRVAGLTTAQRELHRRILRAFVDDGNPTPGQLTAWAGEQRLEESQAFAALAAHDLVHRDPESGSVAVAYPFSAAPSAHHVRLADGREVFAMCALDALGIAFMIDKRTRVISADPKTKQGIEVTVDPHGPAEWAPAEAVVVVACGDEGPSADCMCPHTNFAASTASGQALLQEMAGCSGALLEIPHAAEVGRELFGRLLTGDAEVSDAQPDRA